MRPQAQDAGRPVSRSDAWPELGPESAAVVAALAAWRHKAADIVLIAVAAAHMPVVILGILGHGPPMPPVLKSVAMAAYVVVGAAALFRRMDYRPRLLAGFFAVYLGTLVTTLFLPHGPYARNVVLVPVFALVLLGVRAARIAVLASTAIIVLAPLLYMQPGIVRTLGIDPAQLDSEPGVVLFRTTVMAATLFGLMVLLDRFHRFLLDALATQFRAKAELEREAAERSAAQQKVERGMRERQRLEREIASIGDVERRRFGRELHDGVCQQVTAALLRCQALERRLERGGSLSSPELAPLSSLLADTIDDARSVALGLCPLEPEPEALAPALRALTKRTQEMADVPCRFLTAGDVSVPDPAVAQHLYRIAQEALSNAVRHAHASRIAVELRGGDGELRLQVDDDGTGLPAELPTAGMGLRTMAYRAQILAGELTLAPAPGGGTRVLCRVPSLAAAPAVPDHSGDQRWMPAT